ncbi:heterokaryon incompatibility protein-domain-containing protein [Nemania sp. FL0031]|nr:heterokaryon incompatibility protein-domain-containing protein [Nemania sp. FL0031]
MRLIHTASLEFHEFEKSSSSVPPYAILSHTWGDDEVTFRDMVSGPTKSTTKKKKGYDKITQTCRLAREAKLEYVWIDTCCIDKSSSAELSESINSMFDWYANSAVCYVFLFDYIPGELRKLVFYDAKWAHAGTKVSRVDQIHEITEIKVSVLMEKSYIYHCPVAERMSWAASRQTTRIEDEAYCLFGIFGIHLPLIYGEGRMAFRRLQEEIIKHSADLSIFFWHTPVRNDGARPEYLSMFAESPSNFSNAMGSILRRGDVGGDDCP